MSLPSRSGSGALRREARPLDALPGSNRSLSRNAAGRRESELLSVSTRPTLPPSPLAAPAAPASAHPASRFRPAPTVARAAAPRPARPWPLLPAAWRPLCFRQLQGPAGAPPRGEGATGTLAAPFPQLDLSGPRAVWEPETSQCPGFELLLGLGPPTTYLVMAQEPVYPDDPFLVCDPGGLAAPRAALFSTHSLCEEGPRT